MMTSSKIDGQNEARKIIIGGLTFEFFTIKFRNLVKSFNLHYVCFMDENLTTTFTVFKVDDILIDRENASYSRLHQINDGFLTKLFFRHFRMRYAAAATGFDANSSLEKKSYVCYDCYWGFSKVSKKRLALMILWKTSKFHFRYIFLS